MKNLHPFSLQHTDSKIAPPHPQLNLKPGRNLVESFCPPLHPGEAVHKSMLFLGSQGKCFYNLPPHLFQHLATLNTRNLGPCESLTFKWVITTNMDKMQGPQSEKTWTEMCKVGEVSALGRCWEWEVWPSWDLCSCSEWALLSSSPSITCRKPGLQLPDLWIFF